MSPPGYTPLEPTLPGPGKINVFHKADPQLFQSEALGLAIAILCRVRTRHIARLGHVAALISRVLHGFGRPVAVILHVEPAPNLGITVKSDNVPADGLIMIPDRLLRLPADPRGGACLLAKVEAFPVSQDQVPLDHAFRAAGKRNAGLCAPAPGSRGISVAGDHVVVSLQTVGNLVENPAVLVVGDEALAHDAMLVANIEPDAMTAIAEESASLQDGTARHNTSNTVPVGAGRATPPFASAFPATSICSELRILHRGYTSLKWQSKDGLERNLRIARARARRSEVDHSRALFDYGRTLAGGDDPRSAIASLREAADSTTFPMVRRAALRTIFDVHLGLNQFDEASETIDEMRRGLTKTINADVMDVRLLLGKKCYEACLEAIDRLPFADTDEDGFETGRASLSWAKAQALDSLGRPGDAADALLDALRTHGQLDVSLAALMALLSRAGRSASEIAQKSRPESMPVLVATASRLPAPEADEVLAPFAEAYPQHLEPLAAARDMASRLGVPRAMWWSNRFRRAGFDEMCPLLRIVRDDTREPLFRLLAAAGGYLSFRDQRLVAPAREALASISAEDRRAAAEHVSGISPELAKLLSSGTQAVRLSRGGTTLDGYLCYRTGPGTSGDVVDPGALPFGTARPARACGRRRALLGPPRPCRRGLVRVGACPVRRRASELRSAEPRSRRGAARQGTVR